MIDPAPPSAAPFTPPRVAVAQALSRSSALLWGVMLTLCVTGYTFGQSNQHVYLLDAIRFNHDELLRRDWFVTHTLQYHYLYTLLTVGLAKVGLLQVGFFTLYLGLVIAMHAAWWSIVRSIGGNAQTYLLSVLIYHLSGGGLGLGVYQILQDGSFLPSNIAAVATLGATAYWLRNGLWQTASCVALAGLFHVNYAMACVGAWVGLTLLAMWRERAIRRFVRPATIAAACLALGPCLYTIAVTGLAATGQQATIPMKDFFAVYVHLRHSHHHEPLAWPAALWISFLWPVPLAIYALWILPKTRAIRGVTVVLATLLALQIVALLFAGVWYVSQTLVMLSLFRFSPFAKLLTCVLAAWLIGERWRLGRRVLPIVCVAIGIGLLALLARRDRWPTDVPLPSVGLLAGSAMLSVWVGLELSKLKHGQVARATLAVALLLGLPVCIALAAEQRLGVAMPGEDDAEMADICAWAKLNTVPDSLFLVPPHDMSFVLAARRAEVVSFKHVPQLPAELIEWKHRLDDVLDMDVATLPTPMPRTMAAMADRYATLSRAHLDHIADAYGCNYLVAMTPFPDRHWSHASPGGRYFVYRVVDRPPTTVPTPSP